MGYWSRAREAQRCEGMSGVVGREAWEVDYQTASIPQLSQESSWKTRQRFDEEVETKKEESKTAKTLAETKHTKAVTTFIAMPKLPDKDGSEVAGSFGSQTSYEQTMMGGTTEHKLTVPQVPEMAFEGIPFRYGEPFQCPYCYTEQSVKNRSAWKYGSHVTSISLYSRFLIWKITDHK